MLSASASTEESTADAEVLTAILLRLALGRQVSEVPPQLWERLLARAERERVIGLVWKRSADVVRTLAPPPVASQWRHRALAMGLQSERQLGVLSATVTALRARGLTPVILKGPPLAQRLYGEHGVRWMTDCDLYLAPHERRDASDVVLAAGWRWVSGEPPDEETFEWRHHRILLELHSNALDDPLLPHIGIPVEHDEVAVGGQMLPAHTGRLLPAFLAAHLAKHGSTPLLWIIDFHTLWNAMGDADRADAESAARDVGLLRHLRWAQRLAAAVDAIGDSGRDNHAARRLLSVQLRPISERRRLLRLLELSASPTDMLRVVGGRIWPPTWRDGWRNVPRYLARRASRWAHRRSVFERADGATRPPAREALALDGESALSNVVMRLKDDGAVWVSPLDGSMEPAIPSFARARIVAIGDRALSPGDVLLTRLRHAAGLHRIDRIEGDTFRLRADAQLRTERLVTAGDVLGVCDLVDVRGVVERIEKRPYGVLGLMRDIAGRRRRVTDP